MKRQSQIRLARERAGVGVRELGRRMDVTGSAVSQWERSEIDGTAQIRTIEKAIGELGDDLVLIARARSRAAWRRLTRREERVGLEIHRSIAKKLIDDPAQVLSVVPRNVERMRGVVRGSVGHGWLDEWLELAHGPIGPLIETMLDTDQHSIDLRQNSPFAGALTQDERVQAIQRAATL
jgi:transcriptional regulator with XRE-family HTH domain